MRIVAIVCNIVLFVITSMIVLTEGIPGRAPYLILTLLPMLVPLLSLIVLLRGGMTLQERKTRDDPSSMSALVDRVAVLCNFVLVGFTCWAAVAQYPYAEGNGVIPFALLMVLTPILTLVVLFAGRKRKTQGQEGTIG
jgi:hypothetical protein